MGIFKTVKFLMILGLSQTAFSITSWFKIITGGRFVEAMTVCGPNSEYIVQGEKNKFDAYTVDWTTGVLTRAKIINLIGYSNLVSSNGFMGTAGKSTKVFYGENTIVRFNPDPSSPQEDEEYPVVTGAPHYNPTWIPKTDFMLSGSEAQTAGSYRLYRFQATTTSNMKILSLSAKTRSYGMLAGSTWLVVSLNGTDQRKLFDYTNAFDGGSSSATSTHTKAAGINSEVGLMSAADQRGYYVVSSGDDRTIHTVKDTDGSQKLERALLTLTGKIQTLTWIIDTNLVVVPCYKSRFAIVDFMDETKSTTPVYVLLPSNHWKMRTSFV